MGGLSGSPGQVTITPVYWAPTGYSFSAGYKSIVNGYLENVALASGQDSNVFSVMTQYYQQGLAAGSPVLHIRYAVSVRAEIDDTDGFPAQSALQGCIADGGFSACVNDAALQSELQSQIASLGLPISDSNLYMVMFPQGVETCIGSGVASTTNKCSTNNYCAYHSSSDALPYLVYSNQPYPDIAHCSDPINGAQQPNGDPYADDQISLISHEANEAITDWSGAWIDSSGRENGDECAYVYGAPLGSAGGAQTFYNQVIGSGKYYTQDEFSNEDYAVRRGDLTTAGGSFVPGCVQREEAPVASFTTPSSVQAGASTVFDASASTDVDGTGALTYSWNWGDGTPIGTTVTAAHVFWTPGTYQLVLIVTDADGWTGSKVQTIIASSPRLAPAQSSPGGVTSPRPGVSQSSPVPSPPSR